VTDSKGDPGIKQDSKNEMEGGLRKETLKIFVGNNSGQAILLPRDKVQDSGDFIKLSSGNRSALPEISDYLI